MMGMRRESEGREREKRVWSKGRLFLFLKTWRLLGLIDSCSALTVKIYNF